MHDRWNRLSYPSATGAWLAFVDDDERAGSDWLLRLLECAQRLRADGVLGPVICVPPPHAPAWIRRGKFYALPRATTGSTVPPNRLFIGNALLRADVLRAIEGPFRAEFGLTGGEDCDALARLSRCGAHLVWCDEAELAEPVAPSRLTLGWILKRAMSGGQIYARIWKEGGYGPLNRFALPVFVLRCGLQAGVALMMAAASLVIGRHRSVQWLCKAMAAYGKLGALRGARFFQYDAPPSGRATSD